VKRSTLIILAALLMLVVCGSSTVAQTAPTELPADPTANLNPVSALESASEAIPGFEGGLSGAINVLILLTVLTIAPSILMMCTCFTRFVVVLSLVRQAIGTAQLPPSQVIVGLSLFMTALVMEPTFTRMYNEAYVPYKQGDPNVQSQLDVWNRAKDPLRDFMFAQIDAAGNWDGVYMILDYRGIDTSKPEDLTYNDVDMLTLVPAFILSELKVSFLIGFRVYLPFLIIDMVVSSLLISMGMLMLPPVLISLPFKLLLFVLVDGWTLMLGNLLHGTAANTESYSALLPAVHPLLVAAGLA